MQRDRVGLPGDQSRALLMRTTIKNDDERRIWQRVRIAERAAGAGASEASDAAWNAVEVSRLPERERVEYQRVYDFQRRIGASASSAVRRGWEAVGKLRENSRQLSLFEDRNA